MARQIYDLLLIIGEEFMQRDLERELFEIVREKVFKKTDWEGLRFNTTCEQYRRGIRLLTLKSEQLISDSRRPKNKIKAGLLLESKWMKFRQLLKIKLLPD